MAEYMETRKFYIGLKLNENPSNYSIISVTLISSFGVFHDDVFENYLVLGYDSASLGNLAPNVSKDP